MLLRSLAMLLVPFYVRCAQLKDERRKKGGNTGNETWGGLRMVMMRIVVGRNLESSREQRVNKIDLSIQ